MSAITYTASGATLALAEGTFPAGITGTASGASRTIISGRPSELGVFTYTVSATESAHGCSSYATGAITVKQPAIPVPSSTCTDHEVNMNKFVLHRIFTCRRTIIPAACSYNANFTGGSTNAVYAIKNNAVFYSQECLRVAEDTLCPSPWRVPKQSDMPPTTSGFGFFSDVLERIHGYFIDSAFQEKPNLKVDTVYFYVFSNDHTVVNYASVKWSSSSYNQGTKAPDNYGFQVICVRDP
jgi:hypothetical protein